MNGKTYVKSVVVLNPLNGESMENYVILATIELYVGLKNTTKT